MKWLPKLKNCAPIKKTELYPSLICYTSSPTSSYTPLKYTGKNPLKPSRDQSESAENMPDCGLSAFE